jgi:hypothetical protein
VTFFTVEIWHSAWPLFSCTAALHFILLVFNDSDEAKFPNLGDDFVQLSGQLQMTREFGMATGQI